MMSKKYQRLEGQRYTALARSSQKRQVGLTLVELLVALVISTVVVVAAFSALIVSRQGFTATDTASQLRDNARFLTDLIQRIGVQAGYLDYKFATTPIGNAAAIAAIPEPDVKGFNNALASGTAPDLNFTPRGALSIDGSDVLVLRYQASETYPGSGVLDNSMVNCNGVPAQSLPANRNDRVRNVFHIVVSAIDNEPSLMCSTYNTLTSALDTQPIIRGVETFQVLYGVDGVTPNTALPATLPTTANIPTRYLRADQMVVAGNADETNRNWGRVRSLLIGMVIRGPAGSAPERTALTYYPFGSAPGSSTGSRGSSMASANDPGTEFKPPSDNRLRQVVTFVVHLRNGQD
jgi:type IV pilus assembly protein PilW